MITMNATVLMIVYGMYIPDVNSSNVDKFFGFAAVICDVP